MVHEESYVDPELVEDGYEDESLDEMWTAGRDHVRDDQPDGKFLVEIVNAELGVSQSSGRRQIVWELLILTEEKQGITLYKYDGLGSPQQVSIVQQGLRKLGVPVGQMSGADLPGALDGLIGQCTTVLCKHNGDYYNIYFQSAAIPKMASDEQAM